MPRPLMRAITLEGLPLNQTGTRPGYDDSARAGAFQLRDPGGSRAGWRGVEWVHSQVLVWDGSDSSALLSGSSGSTGQRPKAALGSPGRRGWGD